jgi:hypothetical protein
MFDEDDNLTVPDVDALLAGTLAAMTCWADPCRDCRTDADTQRDLLARKVVCNLFFLTRHPAVSPPLREVMAQAHQRWLGLARGAMALQPITASAASVLH